MTNFNSDALWQLHPSHTVSVRTKRPLRAVFTYDLVTQPRQVMASDRSAKIAI